VRAKITDWDKEANFLPHFSFVILCYNNWDTSKQAITSLIESLNPSYYQRGVEIIVVNNGSTDETAFGSLQLQRTYKEQVQIKILQNEENLGYPAGINSGLAHCNGEIITVLNNDLVFPENWFDGLIKTLGTDPTIGAVAPYLSYASGSQHVGINCNSLEEMNEFAKFFMTRNKEKVIYVDRVIGACMVFKRSVIEIIGGNDLWYGIGNFDDDDWTMRLRIAGFNIALVGSSFVHHLGSVSFNKDPYLFNNALLTNYQKFLKKWNIRTWDHVVKEKIIAETAFHKKHHFCPIRIEQFTEPNKKFESNTGKLNLLYVADWTNPKSEWKKKLNEIMSYDLDGVKIFFWVPSNYYEGPTIREEIYDLVPNGNIDIDLMDNIIPHIELLKFLSDFDVFVKIEGDFVNKNFKKLAQHLSLDLI
jgi:GT2 family glycosyltransferase